MSSTPKFPNTAREDDSYWVSLAGIVQPKNNAHFIVVFLTLMNSQKVVTPVKTGAHSSDTYLKILGSGFCQNEKMHFLTFYETINFGCVITSLGREGVNNLPTQRLTGTCYIFYR